MTVDYEFWWVKYSWSCTGISTNPILKPSPPRKNEGQIHSHCVKTILVNPCPYSIWKPRNSQKFSEFPWISLNFPEFPWRNSWDLPNLPIESPIASPWGWRLAGPRSWWHSCPWKATGLLTWGGFTMENGTKNGGFRGDSWSKLGLEVGCLLGLCMFMLHNATSMGS